jgi:hypothetical protein
MKIRYFLHVFVFLILSSPIYTKAAWEWSEPSPQGNALFSIARSTNAETTIAVGDYGTVLRKSGIGPWENLPSIADGSALAAVVWFGNRFLATGPDAGLWQSSDGVSWTLGDATVKGSHLFNLGSAVVCLGTEKVWISSDGVSFSSSPLAVAPYRSAALSGDSLLLVRNDGTIARTQNGMDWTSPVVRPDTFFYAAAGGPNGFLLGAIDRAGGQSNYATLVQLDQSNQTTDIPLPTNADYRYYQILGSANGWLFQNYLSGAIHRRDSSTWNLLTQSTPAFYPNASLSLPGNSTVLAGQRGAMVSLGNGTSLATENTAAFPSDYLFFPRFALAGLSELAVAIDKNTSRPAQYRYYSTVNGTTWNQANPAPISGLSALGVDSGSLVGYCVSNPSTDEGFYRLVGSEWQSFGGPVPTEGAVLSFASNPASSSIVAITRQESFDFTGNYSASRALYYSNNWTDWSLLQLPQAQSSQPPSEEIIETVQWDGSRFVLLLYPGRIFTSVDGLSWNQLPALPDDSSAQLAADYPGQKLPLANTAVSMSSNGQTLVARATKLLANGTSSPLLSANAETFFVFNQGRWWPVSVSASVNTPRRLITRDSSRFLAIGEGEILSSTDGFSWQSHPVQATIAALFWSGSRLFAFTDSFGVLSHPGPLGEGTPIPTTALEPRISTLSSSPQSYTIQFSPLSGQSWSLGKLPSWLSVSPSSGTGNATLTVSVMENTGTNPRGAVFSLGGKSHFLTQKPATLMDSLPLGPGQTSVSLPFTGDWSASPSSALVAFPKNQSQGKGNIRFTVPANESAESRAFTVNVNGMDYSITQQGQNPALLRAGSYTGIVGSLAQDFLPDSLDSYESFGGALKLTLSKPTAALPNGAYTASLSVFHGNQTLLFKSKGALGANGTLSNSTWTTSGKSPTTATVSWNITYDSALHRFASGNITIGDENYGFFAGKHIFDSSRPLSVADSGKATCFLTTFGNEGLSADTGLAALDISPAGTARVAGQLAAGFKITGSFPVLGAVGADYIIPLSFLAPKNQSIISGYTRRSVENMSFDWSGPASWPAPGRSPAELTASLARYTPPSRGGAALGWSAPANLSLSSDAFDSISGEVTLTPPARLAASINASGRSLSLKLNPANGLVTGSLSEPGSKKTAMSLLGAVNQKYESLSSGNGSILGFSTQGSIGTFSILPE